MFICLSLLKILMADMSCLDQESDQVQAVHLLMICLPFQGHHPDMV